MKGKAFEKYILMEQRNESEQDLQKQHIDQQGVSQHVKKKQENIGIQLIISFLKRYFQNSGIDKDRESHLPTKEQQMNIFKPSHLVFVTIKIGLLYLLKDTNFDQTIKAIPFFNTKFSDYSRVEEAMYFIGQNQDPYQVEHIFQKPILVYALYHLKSIPGAISGLFIFFDLLLAELISNYAFTHSKKKDEHLRQRISDFVRIAYHLNPISFFAIITRWTCIFEFTFGLLAVYLFQKNSKFLAGIIYGISLYLNPVMIMLLVPLLCSATLNKQSFLQCLGYLNLSLLTFIGLIFGSYTLTGSLTFIQNAYVHSYHTQLFQPSIGLMWSIFSGMFNNYQAMYHMIFFFIPLAHIFPLVKIFSKAIKENGFTSGMYGFISGVALFIGYYHFSFITIYEIIVIFTLMFTAFEYFVDIKIFMVLIVTPIIILGLTVMLGIYWFYGLTGNPNFMFIQTFVSYIFLIVMVTEAVKSCLFQKKNELKELKDQEKKKEEENKKEASAKKND